MNQSSVYIVVKDVNRTYHFTGVTAITHNLSLKISEKTDTTEETNLVNGAKNQPDKVTLSVVETDAAHSAQGWAARMLDVLEGVKRGRRLCRVVTPYHTYENMLLSAISATQDETNMDGWSGELTFTECTVPVSASQAKTNTNASIPKNTGSTAPANKVTGKVVSAAVAQAAGAIVAAALALDPGSTLQRKLAQAGINTAAVKVVE